MPTKTASKKATNTLPPPPTIDPFLRPVGVMELRYIRMLSNLCALTYFMHKVTPEGMERRHRLRLITSSTAMEARPRLAQVSPLQAIIDGDASAADVPHVVAANANAKASANEKDGEEDDNDIVPAVTTIVTPSHDPISPAMQAISRVQPLVVGNKSLAPTEIVANSLSAAAAAAAMAATSAAGSVVSAAAPIAAPIASNITAFTAFTASATSPLASVASQLQSAAAAGQSTTVATLATVSAAILSGTGAASSANSTKSLSLMEWFVADDDAAKVRYFVIQGSDNLDHWRVNLTFDPVPFEDKALGVKVHRGVYETAQILYDRFLPLVQEYVASAPTARIVFTGHSLGGSLATLLMMMYLRRGVLRPSDLGPVHTFGAPAIFCEGGSGPCGAGCAACDLPLPTSPPSAAAASGLLHKLGLSSEAVRNVIMHRDIVPRAFACDYSLVADLLRRVGESFREHKCLSGGRRVMFNFVGKMMVLQPAASAKFVGTEGYHAMLPSQPGMFVVREPAPGGRGVGGGAFVEAMMDAASVSNLAATASSSMSINSPSMSSSSVSKKSGAAGAAPVVASADEAVWQLMNFPHPLDILADPGAYGDSGSISRYHNPDNYTRAIGGVLRARGSALVNKAKERGVSYQPPHLAPPPVHHSSSTTATTSGNAVAMGVGVGGKMHSPLAIHPAPPGQRSRPRRTPSEDELNAMMIRQ